MWTVEYELWNSQQEAHCDVFCQMSEEKTDWTHNKYFRLEIVGRSQSANFLFETLIFKFL